ncbi:hypothetical protein GN958_ATG00313 [Phytophthora infestans]|uniref:Ubiquitin-like protease family profile domain-containing protein n=1 Tax=Phytophthora infestans TaxID=4787 RepID=A0A8S9VIP2_PHYIN|nr:hypothetical protein GN958_ATG00313 [Phytophthora infestans]
MSRAEVRAFVTKKREQYAARYTAGAVEAPPLPVTRACKRSKTQASPRTKQPDHLDGIGEESPESPDDCRDPDYVLDAGDDIAGADEDISADDEAACVSPPAEVLTCSTDKEARHYFGISESSDDEGQQPPTQSNLQLDQTERLQIEHPEKSQGGQQETLHLDHPEKLQGVLPMNLQGGLPEKVNSSVKPFENAGMPSRFLSLPSDSCVGFLKQFPSRWLSWERFHSELHAFSAQTNQRFIVRSTSSVKKRNDQIFPLLSFRRCQWLSTTSILTATHALAIKYGETGVVSPSFAGMKEPDRKRKVANAYNAFSGTNTEIIGVLNIGGVHWVAYHIDVRAQTCRLFDPQQGTASYNELEAAVKEVVEPLLSLNSELIYYKFTSCLQEDNDNCGLWCLVILELTLGRTPWNKVLYELVPYLRLRYLGMCTSYIEEQRGGR